MAELGQANPKATLAQDDLTPRENDIVWLAAEGWTNAVIGNFLGLKGKTIGNYLGWIYDKLGSRQYGKNARIVLTGWVRDLPEEKQESMRRQVRERII